MPLSKMLIQSYTDDKFSAPGPSYTVFLNPESFSHNVEVSYSKTDTPGQSGVTSKFNAVSDEKVGFDLMFDGTGTVVGKVIDVDTEITKLRDVVLKYQGKLHSPYYLQLSWGTLLFNCHLTKFDVSYTLFKPDGSPLRAKVSMAFLGFTDNETKAKRADRQSSDLTHYYRVQAGDTLPLLCHRIYGHSRYYLAVANHNHLINFRQLDPGLLLRFPPLV